VNSAVLVQCGVTVFFMGMPLTVWHMFFWFIDSSNLVWSLFAPNFLSGVLGIAGGEAVGVGPGVGVVDVGGGVGGGSEAEGILGGVVGGCGVVVAVVVVVQAGFEVVVLAGES
jgi:hypothetical protein